MWLDREIRSALASGDIDLAQSFVELAADRGVQLDPALVGRSTKRRRTKAQLLNTAGRFLYGFWTGAPTDSASWLEQP